MLRVMCKAFGIVAGRVVEQTGQTTFHEKPFEKSIIVWLLSHESPSHGRDCVQDAALSTMNSTMQPAGFWRRLGAYLIDVIPITLLTALPFYLLLGFDQTWKAYLADPHDLEAKAQFLSERNVIRDTAFLLWLIYSTIMEGSAYQGTFGKQLAGIRVVGPEGQRLTLGRAVSRNLAKLLSYLPLGLGFLWVGFSKHKHAWHDMIAKTDVIRAGSLDEH